MSSDLIETQERPAQEAAQPRIRDYLLAMSRELRAPLNAIIGMAGLLLDADLAPKPRQYAKGVHHAGETLGAMLNDLLDLACLEAGLLAIDPIVFDLRAMVDETVSVLMPRAGERGLALRVDWRPDVPRLVVGDPGRIRQILGNLVDHSVNSTNRGEIVLRVGYETEAGVPGRLRFAVEDTGIGFPPERLERVFEEYVPVDASPYRSFAVTGLGLRISRELTRVMGGEIGVASEVGRGTRFWFTVPALVGEETAKDWVTEGPVRRSGGRVLIVEADPPGRVRYTADAEAADWEVDFVEQLSEVEGRLRRAVEQETPFDACLLSDYAVRPAHEELARALKAEPALEPVALVMVTAVGSAGEGKRLWHAGFAGYLRRPLAKGELPEALAGLRQAGRDGRCAGLITRHSLAEARGARAAAVDQLDAVLDHLLVPSPEALPTVSPDPPNAQRAPLPVPQPTEPFALLSAGSAVPDPQVESVPSGDETPEPIASAALLEELRSGRGTQLGGLAYELVATFLTDAPGRIAELVTAVGRSDWGRIRRTAGTLGERCALLGAPRMASLCRGVVVAADSDDRGATAARLGEVEQAFLGLRLALEQVVPDEDPPHPLEPSVDPDILAQLRAQTRENCGPTLVSRLVETFRNEAPRRLDDLRAAAGRQDQESVRRLARTLKGMCGLLGAAPLALVCGAVETAAEPLQAAGVQRLVRELDRVLEALQHATT